MLNHTFNQKYDNLTMLSSNKITFEIIYSLFQAKTIYTETILLMGNAKVNISKKESVLCIK